MNLLINGYKRIVRSLSTFANTDVGTLLLGEKNNGKIAGINPEEEFYMIEIAANIYNKPKVQFSYNIHEIESKSVAEIIIEPSIIKPHLAPSSNVKWLAYIRKNDKNFLANRVLLEYWRLEYSIDTTILMLDDVTLFKF